VTRGLFLGKFMPIHNGHLFVIEVALKLVDELTVLVCSIDTESIDGRLRAAWVRKSVPEGVVVQELHGDMPQAPEDDGDFWSIWRNAINQYGSFDKVFGGEEYVVRLAQEIGATPIPLGRNTVNISATKIRENPDESWAYIPPAVRPYFQRRVTFLGPESTGKSTFSAMLAKRVNPKGDLSNLMTEYGRIYDTTLKKGQSWCSEDFQDLAATHIAMREVLAKHAGPLLIEDTDVIQTMAWEQALLGVVNYESYPLQNPADLYLLLSPEVEWIDDGTRYGDKFRVAMFDFLKMQLEHLKLPYEVISGNEWHVRERLVFNVVDRFMSEIQGFKNIWRS